MTSRDYTDEALDRLRDEVDPDVDKVVEDHYALLEDKNPRTFLRSLIDGEGLGGSEPVQEYLRTPFDRPHWLDPLKVAAGQERFAHWGSHVFTALYAASLPTAYACHRGVQVLGQTSQLVTNTKRRLNETAQFHLDVMEPDGLTDRGRGLSDIRHVRLMHAGVRWLIEHDPEAEWDPQWGRPINQEDMLETLLTFTEVVFEVFDRTGVVYSVDDAEAYLHVWSYVGFLLGVHPDQLPLTRTDTKALMAAVRRRQFGASASGVLLMGALLEEGRKLTPPGLRGLPASTVRFFVGDTTADYLSVPPADWTKVFFGPLKRLTHALSAEKAHRALLRNLSDRVGLGMLQLAVSAERSGKRPDFAIPTVLADGWGVTTTGVPLGRDLRRARRAASR
jgi:hypothetical protein